MKRVLAPLLLILLLPLTSLAESDDPANSKWDFLGLPYLSVDPDFGTILGLAAGVQRAPNTSFIVNSSISTGGQMGMTLRGETGSDASTQVFTFRQWLNPAGVYPNIGALPDPSAVALLQRSEIKFAWLNRYTETFEFGPELWMEFDKGIDPETDGGIPLDVATIPRFQQGNMTLAGLRARYRTTSATRPLDGVIVDAALRAGRVDGITMTTPRLNVSGDLWLAMAKPLSGDVRLYSRIWFRAQSEAPVSVRNDLGGSRTLRGQPYNRDYGRRLIASRFQLHWTAMRNVTLFSDIAQYFIPIFPTLDLEVELAPFADIGAVGDPDLGGWSKTRQGYGLSFRFVLPPTLVFYIDLGYSPGGRPLLYFGGGETL